MKQLTTKEILARLTNPVERREFVSSWPFLRCYLCKMKPATGVWMCQFSTPTGFRSELKLLCPGCGMTDCYAKWNGFMSPRLLRCDLFLTISCPEGDKLTPADRHIEKLLTHPRGEEYLRAWKLMYKPANIHHPIQPAFLMLEALVEKLFPPQTNKGD